MFSTYETNLVCSIMCLQHFKRSKIHSFKMDNNVRARALYVFREYVYSKVRDKLKNNGGQYLKCYHQCIFVRLFLLRIYSTTIVY